MSNKKSHIYKIINKINGKEYIGVSQDPQIRFEDHCKNSRNTIISRAIKKYGKENFKVSTLLTGPEDYCFEMEGLLIDCFNSRKPNGYNIALGGRGNRAGTKMSDEARANLSKAMSGKKRKPMSEETKAKIASAQKGILRKKHTEESLKKLSQAAKGRILSEEHKNNLSAARNKQSYESVDKKRKENISYLKDKESYIENTKNILKLSRNKKPG